jgi:sugar/nucleoside kinase (ribokinase family)
MKVVCVGDCGVDHYLPSGEQRFGGITANFARHARKEFRADDEIHIVSCIGDDDGVAIFRRSRAPPPLNTSSSKPTVKEILSAMTPVF